MDRRAWLKRMGLMAAAGVAADQLELLDRLNWKRTLFQSAPIGGQITPDVWDQRGFLNYSFQFGGPDLISEAPATNHLGGRRGIKSYDGSVTFEARPDDATVAMLVKAFDENSTLDVEWGDRVFRDVRVVKYTVEYDANHHSPHRSI